MVVLFGGRYCRAVADSEEKGCEKAPLSETDGRRLVAVLEHGAMGHEMCPMVGQRYFSNLLEEEKMQD